MLGLISRPPRLVLPGLILFSLVLLGARQALAQATNPLPPSRVIVYDSSGSMWSTGRDGKARYELARAFVARLVAHARGEPAPVSYGMVSLGRLFDQQLGQCERDIQVDVRPGRSSDSIIGDRILAATRSARPMGRTPLYDALLTAADQVPVGEAATLIVVTDLDDEICGSPPCDVVAELTRRGRPIPAKTRVEFLVMVGVDPNRSRIVQALRGCMPATQVIAVYTADEAVAEGNRVAEELARRTAAQPGFLQPAAPAPLPPVAAGRQPLRVDLGFDFPGETLRFPGDLQRAGLRLRGTTSAGRRLQSQEVTGDSMAFEMEPGIVYLILEQDARAVVPNWQEQFQPGGTLRASKVLPPARLVAVGDGLTADQGFEWTVTEVTTGQLRTRTGGAELLIVPGNYHVVVRMQGWQGQAEVTLRFGDGQTVPILRQGEPPAPVPRSGVLTVRTQVQRGSWSAASAGSPTIQLNGPAGPRSARSDDPLHDLPPGAYVATADAAGLETRADRVVVEPGSSTDLTLLLAPARLKLKLTEPADRVVWTLTPQPAGPPIPSLRGAEVDLLLRPGRYRVQVKADQGSYDGEITVQDFVQRRLPLSPFH